MERKNATCDLCGMKDLDVGYFLPPNFDVCTFCFRKVKKKEVELSDMYKLIDACVESMKPFRASSECSDGADKFR